MNCTSNEAFLNSVNSYDKYTENIYKSIKKNLKKDTLIFRRNNFWYKFENWDLPYSGIIREWIVSSDDWTPKIDYSDEFSKDKSKVIFDLSYMNPYLRNRKIKSINLSSDNSLIVVVVGDELQSDIYLFEKGLEINEVAAIKDISIEGALYCNQFGILFCRKSVDGRPYRLYYKNFISGEERLLLNDLEICNRLKIIQSRLSKYCFVTSSNFKISDVYVYSFDKYMANSIFSFKDSFPKKYEILEINKKDFIVFIDNSKNDKKTLKIKGLTTIHELNIDISDIDKVMSIDCFGNHVLINCSDNFKNLYLDIEVIFTESMCYKKREKFFDCKTIIYENSYANNKIFLVQNKNAFISVLLCYDLVSGELAEVFKIPNCTENNIHNYHHKVIWCSSPDYKVKIPITLFWKGEESDELPKSKPCVIYAYGAYGKKEYSSLVSPEIISIINEGFLYAIVHVRGGGYLGGDWYREGKGLKKWNSINDLIEATDYLCKKGIADEKHLGFTTSSAGGILAGATLNVRNNLFRAMLLYSPYINPLDSLLDKTDPLSETEKLEWGDIDNDSVKKYINSYSPMQNVQKARGSKTIVINIIGSKDFYINNDHVVHWNKALNSYGVNSLLYKNDNAGHGGLERGEEYLLSKTLNFFLEKIMEGGF